MKTLKSQWPTSASVLNLNHLWKVVELLNSNPVVCVTEKLDGANLSVCSSGWIASRRCVIVENASVTDLEKKTFMKCSLDSLKPALAAAKAMAQKFQEALPHHSELQVQLFGEWMWNSSLDAYDYDKRKILPGHFYAFGLGILPPPNLGSDSVVWTLCVEEALEKEFGLECHSCPAADGHEEGFLLVNLNQALLDLFESHNVETVPVLDKPTFCNVFLDPENYNCLLEGTMEGVVIVVRGVLQTLKWKSCNLFDFGTQQGQTLIWLRKMLDGKHPQVLQQLERVAFPFLMDPDHVKLLKAAYKSAKSKYPLLSEVLVEETMFPSQTLETYLDALEEDMMQELVRGYPRQTVSYYVNSREKFAPDFNWDLVNYYPQQ